MENNNQKGFSSFEFSVDFAIDDYHVFAIGLTVGDDEEFVEVTFKKRGTIERGIQQTKDLENEIGECPDPWSSRLTPRNNSLKDQSLNLENEEDGDMRRDIKESRKSGVGVLNIISSMSLIITMSLFLYHMSLCTDLVY